MQRITFAVLLAQRWEFVTTRGLCPMCLVETHSLLECTSGTCKHCEGDNMHNSPLCDVSYRRKQQSKRDDEHESN